MRSVSVIVCFCIFVVQDEQNRDENSGDRIEWLGWKRARARAGKGWATQYCRLVRPGSSHESIILHDGFQVAWNPATGELGGAAVGADAVVNLAGASIADGRWSAERKAVLHSSRIDTTRALITALAKMNARPSVLVSASATGITAIAVMNS